MKKIAPAPRSAVLRSLPPATPVAYRVRRIRRGADPLQPSVPPEQAEPWKSANVAHVEHFHPAGSDHRPTTQARLVHSADTLYVRFDVRDRFVRCVNERPQTLVSKDTCVELFLQPPGGPGYFNLEMNCGGTYLMYYITDARRHPQRLFRQYCEVPPEATRSLVICSTLPPRVEPELEGPVDWALTAAVPVAVLASCAASVKAFEGRWRGNFFKCGDDTSHPHWAAWSPIGRVLRFHQPEKFGVIEFE